MTMFTKKERSDTEEFNEWLKSNEFVDKNGIVVTPKLVDSEDTGEDKEKD